MALEVCFCIEVSNDEVEVDIVNVRNSNNNNVYLEAGHAMQYFVAMYLELAFFAPSLLHSSLS